MNIFGDFWSTAGKMTALAVGWGFNEIFCLCSKEMTSWDINKESCRIEDPFKAGPRGRKRNPSSAKDLLEYAYHFRRTNGRLFSLSAEFVL